MGVIAILTNAPRGRQIGILLSQPSFREVVDLVITDRPCGAEVQACSVAVQRMERDFDDRLDEALGDRVGLAIGFTRIIGAGACGRLTGRLYNSHFSLLPAFAARHGSDWTTKELPPRAVFERALLYGARYVGNTIHMISAEVDAGFPVMQSVLPVPDGANPAELRHRLFIQECKMLLQFAEWVRTDRLSSGTGRPVVAGARYDGLEFSPSIECERIAAFAI